MVPGSPAERRGPPPGDRIVRLDGRPIRTPDDLTDRLDRTPAGAEVALDYLRGRRPAWSSDRPPPPPRAGHGRPLTKDADPRPALPPEIAIGSGSSSTGSTTSRSARSRSNPRGPDLPDSARRSRAPISVGWSEPREARTTLQFYLRQPAPGLTGSDLGSRRIRGTPMSTTTTSPV